MIVEAGPAIEAVGVDGTVGGLVGGGQRVPDGHVRGVGAGARYVGGLARVDPSVPGRHVRHSQRGAFSVRIIITSI